MKKLQNYSIDSNALIFLENYVNNASPSGYEYNGQKIWKNYIKDYVDKIETDLYGNIVSIINSNKSKYKIIIEAHADEVSWYVNYISNDGLIYVIRNGGSDNQIALSKKIYIHTEKGLVEGIFGWPAIHLRNIKEEKKTNLDNIFIDIGASNKYEVEKLGVSIGSVVTYNENFFILNKKYFVGRGLDNRIGGFIIAEVAKMLKINNIKLPFCLYIVNSVQEEVGLRGAQMITQSIKPNIAIVTDVCHDTSTPTINKKIHGDIKCGLGPVISYAPSIHNKLRNFIINTAYKNNIKIQKLASSRYTGTDTDAFAYSNGGVVSALISIPLKYMHTTVETVNKKDIEKTIFLIFESLKDLNIDYNFKYDI